MYTFYPEKTGSVQIIAESFYPCSVKCAISSELSVGLSWKDSVGSFFLYMGKENK